MTRNAGRWIVLLAVGAALAVPGTALGDITDVYRDYATDGTLSGCDYSSGELQGTLGEIPADVRQYDPGFGNAINNAIGQGASGACASGGGGAGSGADIVAAQLARDPGSSTKGGAPKPPGTLRSGSVAADLDPERGFPLALAALALALATAMVAGGGFALARHYEWEPPGWMQSVLDRLSAAGASLQDFFWGLRDRVGR